MIINQTNTNQSPKLLLLLLLLFLLASLHATTVAHPEPREVNIMHTTIPHSNQDIPYKSRREGYDPYEVLHMYMYTSIVLLHLDLPWSLSTALAPPSPGAEDTTCMMHLASHVQHKHSPGPQPPNRVARNMNLNHVHFVPHSCTVHEVMYCTSYGKRASRHP